MSQEWMKLQSIEAKIDKIFIWFKHLEEKIDLLSNQVRRGRIE